MSGTKIGGLRAAATNKERRGEDWYAHIGSIGGRKGTTGGFYANRELARTAGAIGGQKPKRGMARKSRLEGLKVGDYIWDSCTPTEAHQRWSTPAQRLGMKIQVSAHGSMSKVLRVE